MENPLTKLDLLGKRLPVTVAATAVLIVATAILYATRPGVDDDKSAIGTDDIGGSTAVADTTTASSSSSPTTTSILPDTTDAPTSSTAADGTEPSAEPVGMADQFDFSLGGADNSLIPSCEAGEGEVVGGVVVYPATTVVVLEPSVVCFPGLPVDVPVEVTITAPGEGSTTMTASVTEPSLGAPAPVPYVDFTRHPRDPEGDYTVQAHGTGDPSVTVRVVDPDHPVVAVIDGEDSVELVAAGFPPSQQIMIGLYREPEPAVSDAFNLMRSFAPTTNARGHASVSLAMPPEVPGTDLYGVHTIPESVAANNGGDANGRLVFRWPPW